MTSPHADTDTRGQEDIGTRHTVAPIQAATYSIHPVLGKLTHIYQDGWLYIYHRSGKCLNAHPVAWMYRDGGARVVVAGTRTFANYGMLCRKLDEVLRNLSDVAIVSGCAAGADTLGAQYAAERGYPVLRFPADWRAYPRRAGPLRNEAMAEIATHVVVFWDGKSRGSKNMVDISKRRGLPLRVIRY